MDKNFEKFKLKVQQLVNHYSANNYLFVIQQVNLLLKKQPNNHFILNLLGSSYHKIGRLKEARSVFFRVIQLDENNLAAMNNLANVHKDLSNFNEAKILYEKILKKNSNYINAIVNYANLKFQLNQYNQSLNLYKRALKIDKNSTIVYYNIGLLYQSLGKFDDAKASFNEALRINPDMCLMDRLISRLTKYKTGDSHLIKMLNKLELHSLNNESKINLYFALGKAYEDLLDYEKSFYYLEKGNKIKSKITKYNFKQDEQLFNNIFKKFDNYNFTENISKNKTNKNIIFILGLPRSGTSLIEQIISSHSKVYGAGELDFLEKLMRFNFIENDKFKIPDLKESSIIDLTNKISSKYHELLNNFDINELIITDKAPLNFRWIGFIKMLFPGAKIIHCVRDPKDNCMSLYKNIFDENQNWTYNQTDLFNYYKNYRNLMNFWKSKLPNFIYDCKYEEIINNSNVEIKKLLEFCNLSWEEKCLEFYKSKKAIKTVSVAQARRPLYNSSISSSKNYDLFLRDLFNDLDNLVE
jgi:tetratricopeptide (TPR) repeat protein